MQQLPTGFINTLITASEPNEQPPFSDIGEIGYWNDEGTHFLDHSLRKQTEGTTKETNPKPRGL